MVGPFLKRHPPTEQELNPHPQLLQCRNALQTVLEVSRKQAGHWATWMTGAQVAAVVAAGSDAEAVQAIVDAVTIPEEYRWTDS